MMSLLKRLSAGVAGLLLLVLPLFGHAEDIDVFVGGTGGSGGLPNVLVVLDNTSNWSRQSQQWPGGLAQGQSEARAIKTAMAGLVDKANVGLIEFTTDGNANQDGGFVRFALQKLDSTSQATLNTRLDQIFNNVTGTVEKRNSGTPYGNLMFDVYNYLAGSAQSYSGGGTPSSIADDNGYVTKYSQFKTPLNAENACVKTYVIFVSNPDQSGPSTDSSTNSDKLKALYQQVAAELNVTGIASDKLAAQSSGTPLPIPLFTTTTISDVTYKNWTVGQCYADATSCTADQKTTGKQCDGVSNCSCSVLTADSKIASCQKIQGTQYREYRVMVDNSKTVVAGTGEYNTTKGAAWNLDDWAKFLNLYGVPVPYTDASGQTQIQRMPVVTYTIDVFNAQQNADHTGLMMSTATAGGGKPFIAKNEDAIVDAFNKAASEILSASSTFAAVALPLSATNRAQNENQVFIGMFRPNGDATPRWFGNLKRYQVALINGHAALADMNSEPAINALTNFPGECAQSFWSVDSNEYWKDKGVTPPPLSKCVMSMLNPPSPWSDAPDGPFVEKGGAAQRLRDYPTKAAPDITKRKVLTVDPSGGLVNFDSTFATAVGGQDVVDYIRGVETITLNGVTTTRARSTIHGDVVHSRPLPINYGSSSAISVFYGANDGLFRAIDAATGTERWSLVAPEHFDQLSAQGASRKLLSRLKENSPLVAFPNQNMSATPTPLPKDYFFDGSIGQYVVYGPNNVVTKAYIYPTMRRGGRMVYALDVTDPNSPKLLWRKGCPQLNSDTGCSADADANGRTFTGIGQTWSLPKSAFLKGYKNGATPVVIFGGGYDKCEDTDALATTCTSSAKGRAIYVVDAVDGSLVQVIPTAGSVVADVSLVDMDYDGKVDYGYTVDLSGNVWRVNFIDPSAKTAISAGSWKATQIAYTSGGYRKFLNAPSVLPYNGRVYLAFGSGNRERPLETNYPYVNNVKDRYYLFLDNPASTYPYNLEGDRMRDVTAATSCDAPGIYPGDSDTTRGWYMTLPGRGEQVVTSSVIAGGVVAFNTFRPGGSAAGMCKRPMGISTSYQVNLFNASGAIGVDNTCGGSRSVEVGTGLPIAPTIGTVEVGDPNCTGGNCKDTTVTFCIGCEGLNTTEIVPKIDATRKRTYWGSDIDR